MSTKIEWANETWNPVVGCSKISTGCKNCYAERMANRLSGMAQADLERDPLHVDGKTKYIPTVDKGNWTGEIGICERKELEKPLRWKKPRRVFISSMGDLFHGNVENNTIYEVFEIIREANQHTFILLTKRPERAKQVVYDYIDTYWPTVKKVPQNIWFGVTVENQKQAEKRLLTTLNLPFRIVFASVEPILGAIQLNKLEIDGKPTQPTPYMLDALTGATLAKAKNAEWMSWGSGLDWVVSGGETGPGAREVHPDWVRWLHIQCQNADVPFFFKKWGNVKNEDWLIDGEVFGEVAREYPRPGETT